MRTRLLIINPDKAFRPLTEPNLVLEGEGQLLLCGHDWVIPVGNGRLEDLTIKQIRQNLPLPVEKAAFVYLSSVGELPGEDLLSGSLWNDAGQWWIDEVIRLVREGQIPDAPAVKVPV